MRRSRPEALRRRVARLTARCSRGRPGSWNVPAPLTIAVTMRADALPLLRVQETSVFWTLLTPIPAREKMR